MYWILIVFLGQTSLTANFETQEACMKARVEITQAIARGDSSSDEEFKQRSENYYKHTICVPSK